MRRHVVQFTVQEAQLAESLRSLILNQVKRFRMTPHCQKALRDDNGTVGDLAESLKRGRVIEVSRRDGCYRIVTRWESSQDAHCAVWQDDGVAITYWINRASDRHQTLDLTMYSQAPFV